MAELKLKEKKQALLVEFVDDLKKLYKDNGS